MSREVSLSSRVGECSYRLRWPGDGKQPAVPAKCMLQRAVVAGDPGSVRIELVAFAEGASAPLCRIGPALLDGIETSSITLGLAELRRLIPGASEIAIDLVSGGDSYRIRAVSAKSADLLIVQLVYEEDPR